MTLDATGAAALGTASPTFRSLIQAYPLAVMLLDPDGTVRLWNPAAERLFGWGTAEVLGRALPAIPEDGRAEFQARLQEVARGRTLERVEVRCQARQGRRIEAALWAVREHDADGNVRCLVLLVELGESQRSTAPRAPSLAGERATPAARLARLQALMGGLSRGLTPVEVAEVVLTQGLAAMGASAGAVLVLAPEGDDLVILRSVGYAAELVEAYRRVPLTAVLPLADAVRSGQPVWLGSPAARAERYPDLASRHPDSAYHAWAALPLLLDDRAIGGLALSFPEEQRFGDDDRAFLLMLAGQCAQALGRARLFAEELASKERLGVALEAGQMGTWDWDARTHRVIWSPQLEAIHGLAPGTFGGSFEDYLADIHPEDRARVQRTIEESLARGTHQIEYRIVWPDGSVRWVEARGKVVYGQDGRPAGMRGVCMEVTPRKRVEEELARVLARQQRHAEQLRGLAEASVTIASSLSLDVVLQIITERARAIIGAHLAVTSLTLDHNWAQSINTVSLSDKYAAWRGYSAQPDGSGIYALVCRENRPYRLTQAELEAHPAWRGFGKEAGRHPPLRGWLAAPLVGRDGRNLGLIQLSDKEEGEFSEDDEVILVHLARLASIAIENARLYQQAQEAVRARDEFLSIASHELRNPVAGIKGTAQLLQRAQRRGRLDPARLERYLAAIEQTSERLATLTQDLLDVSRLQRGILALRTRRTNLAALVRQVVARHQTSTTIHRFLLEVSDTPAIVTADPDRIEQVVANLLDNALKYSPQGGPVQVSLASDSEGALLRVRDRGIGLPAGAAERIFQPFGRAPNAVEQNIPGLGLGLYICRRIVEQHGGRLWAESEGEGRGTTLSLWLPRAASAAEGASDA